MTPPDKIETPTPRTDAHRQPFIDRPSFELDDVLEAYELAEQLERELTQWREVAGRLAPLVKEVCASHRDWDSSDYNECDKPGEQCHFCDLGLSAIAAYDALAKLSDGGKG